MDTAAIGAVQSVQQDAGTRTTTGVSAATLLRRCGEALMVGGVLAVFGHLVLHPPGHAVEFQQSSSWVIAHALSLASFLLGAVGVLGLYVRVKDRTGVLGLVVTGLLFVGFSFHAMRMADEAWVIPYIALNNTANLTAPGGPLDQAPFLGPASTVRYIVEGLGLVGFSAVVLRSGFARGGAAMMLVSSVVSLVWIYAFGGGLVAGIGLTVLQLGLGWMGYRLWCNPLVARPAGKGAAGSGLV